MTKINLKARRKELKLTLLQIAEHVGVSEATVSRWENGNIANMKRDKIYKLSQILMINPSEIIGFEEINENLDFKTIKFMNDYLKLNNSQKEIVENIIVEFNS